MVTNTLIDYNVAPISNIALGMGFGVWLLAEMGYLEVETFGQL